MYPKLKEAERKVFLFNVFLIFVTCSVLVVSFLWLSQSWLIPFLNKEYDTLPYLDLLCLFILFNIPTFIVEYIYLLTEQAKKIVAFGFIAFTCQIIAVVLPILLGYTFEESFKALILLGVLKLLWTIFLLKKYATFKINFSLVRNFLLLSFPLILYMLLGGSMEYIDGFLVLRYFDEEALAIYRYGAKELPLTLALASAFSSALIPKVAANLEEALTAIKAESKRLVHGLFIISIILMIISPYVFPIVFNPDFKESYQIFNAYLLVLISRLLFPQTILIGLEKTRIILTTSILELLTNFILSILFIQWIGLVGIVYATVISALLEKVIFIAYNHFYLKISPQKYIDIRLYGMYCVVLLGVYVLTF